MTDGPIGKLPLALQDAMAAYFENNACLGQGDLRANTTLEVLQRNEMVDVWTINHKKLGRSDIMEIALDMVAQGYSIPALLALPGFPRPRTFMGWLTDFKPFADLMEVAERMRAVILAEQALDIVDGTTDPKQGFIAKTRADLRMRFAEILHSKKYGKKQTVDVNHHDDLSGTEVWSRMTSMLTVNAALIEEKTGIKIVVPSDFQEADVVEREEVAPDPLEVLGMQGRGNEPSEWDDDLDFSEEQPC